MMMPFGIGLIAVIDFTRIQITAQSPHKPLANRQPRRILQYGYLFRERDTEGYGEAGTRLFVFNREGA